MTSFDTLGGHITSKAAFTASSIGPGAVEGRVLELVGKYASVMSVSPDGPSVTAAPGMHA